MSLCISSFTKYLCSAHSVCARYRSRYYPLKILIRRWAGVVVVVDGDGKQTMCIINKEIIRRWYVQCKQKEQRKEDEEHSLVWLRGCVCFLGGDCFIEEVTFEQRCGELAKELSGGAQLEGECLECLTNSQETLRLALRQPQTGRE